MERNEKEIPVIVEGKEWAMFIMYGALKKYAVAKRGNFCVTRDDEVSCVNSKKCFKQYCHIVVGFR